MDDITMLTKRKQKWLARGFFVSTIGLIPGFLLYLFSTMKVHNTKSHWWFLGHMHNVLEGIGAVVLFGIIVLGICAVFAVVVIGGTTFCEKTLPRWWRIAWK